MSQDKLDVEALKNDAEFQDNVRLLEKEMKEQNSIAKGYQLLDIKLALGDDEEEINNIFTFIVNQAFDTLAGYLTQHRRFNLSDPEEYAAARAIYEHGIQRYSENDRKGAKEIFLVLYHQITESDIKDAMMIHACAVMEGIGFDKFIDEFADVTNIDPEDPKSVFISEFVQPNDMLLAMWAHHADDGRKELEVLEKDDSSQG
jgi:hypothetical protein